MGRSRMNYRCCYASSEVSYEASDAASLLAHVNCYSMFKVPRVLNSQTLRIDIWVSAENGVAIQLHDTCAVE